jgi:hypothetical protein
MRVLTTVECRKICGEGSQLGQSLVTCDSVVSTLATAAINGALGFGVAVSGGGVVAGAAVSFAGDFTGLPSGLGNSFASWACSSYPSDPEMSFQYSVGGMDVGGIGMTLNDLHVDMYC